MNIVSFAKRLLGQLPITDLAAFKTGAKVVAVHSLNLKPNDRFVTTVVLLVTNLDRHQTGEAFLRLKVDTSYIPDFYKLTVTDGQIKVHPGFVRFYYPGLLD